MSRKPISLENNPLFGGPTLAQRVKGGSPFRYLQLAEIDVDPEQPRRVFSEESLNELASSIKEYGVLCPVLVRLLPGGSYRLIAGERRYRAAKLAGLSSIPAIVDDAELGSGAADDSSGILAKQLVENLQREDLAPMERALAVGQLRDRFGLSIREIAARLGVSKSFAQRCIEILQLPDDLQAALIGGASESKILLLAKLEQRETRKALLGQLEDLSRAELERLIGEAQGNGRLELYHGGTENKRARIKFPDDQRVIDELQNALGLKVELRRSAAGGEGGKLTLKFYTKEELGDIFERLTR